VEVFQEIRELTQKPGYIHALSALVFKSNVVTTVDQFSVDDFLKIYQPDRLIRTETNLLVGLMLSAPVDVRVPEIEVLASYVERTVLLLDELHKSIEAGGHEAFLSALKSSAKGDEEKTNPLSSGSILREAIFYGGESAFPFQYKSLARERYAEDRQWLQTQKGFDIDEACEVLSAIRTIVDGNLPKLQDAMKSLHPKEWTFLPLFQFTINDVVQRTGLDSLKVKKIIDCFSTYECD